jgi:hypothetical protein
VKAIADGLHVPVDLGITDAKRQEAKAPGFEIKV